MCNTNGHDGSGFQVRRCKKQKEIGVCGVENMVENEIDTLATKVKKAGFITAYNVNHAYYRDEFSLFMVYGPLGIGKSSYAIKVMAEVLGEKNKPDYNKVKDYMVFHPQDFVEKCYKMAEQGQRDKAIIWDDAGLWLFALDFKNPFIQAIIKYLNVARTNWGAFILTTPTPSWIIYKLRSFPQSVTIKILKVNDDMGRRQRLRVGRAYRFWVMPDMKKTGVRVLYEDYFDAMLPDDVYHDWYQPLRATYAREAALLARKEMEKLGNRLGKDTQQLVDMAIKDYTI
jgi:hypothetical protein